MNPLPQPLAAALDELDQESQPFRRIHRLIDALEVFVKLHTVVLVSDYFQRPEVSDALRRLLGAGLRKPSLGIWWQFARDIAAHMEESGMAPLDPALARSGLPKGLLFRLLEDTDNFIAFRNRYAHGATPPDAACTADLAKYEPRLRTAIGKAAYLSDAAWFFATADGSVESLGGPPPPAAATAPVGQIHLAAAPGTAPLSLHPLLVRHPDTGDIYFYNDLRNKAAAFLNYAACAHWRNRLLRDALLERYPIDEWRALAPDEFRQRIEELTETFEGRREEIRDLLAFVRRKPPGIRLYWGPPGAGKSALLARALQILRWPADLRQREGYEAPDSGDLTLHVLEFFIWRGQRETTAIEYLLKNLSERFEQRFRTGLQADCPTLTDQVRLFRQRLEKAAAGLRPDERLILFIDGLDEAAENSGFLENLPRHVPAGVKLIYASRPQSSVQSLVYEVLDREQRDDRHLQGLTAGDIRALLYDHVSKYRIPAGYVERLAGRSAGNPLFAKLICLGLETGDYRLDDPAGLPGKLEDIYANLCQRLRALPGAHRLLLLFAEARDFLSPALAADILGPDVGPLEATLLPACAEILSVREAPHKVPRYQLFHESLREFLRARYPDDARDLRATLAAFCAKWPSHRGETEHYAVLHLGPHLDHARRDALADARPDEAEAHADTLFAALEDEAFRTRSVLLSGNFTALRRDLKLGQQAAMQRDAHGSEARRIFTYARLYHEESHRLYARQLKQLDAKAAAGDWESVCEIARIAPGPEEQALLLLRATLANSEQANPAPLKSALEALRQTSPNSALKELITAAIPN